MKLKKGDQVQVVTGKDKGKKGPIEKVLPKENKVVILGVNEFKRHIKARMQNQQSEIVTITKPLPVANVMFLCPKCKKTTRIGYMLSKDKKERICRKCKQVI